MSFMSMSKIARVRVYFHNTCVACGEIYALRLSLWEIFVRPRLAQKLMKEHDMETANHVCEGVLHENA